MKKTFPLAILLFLLSPVLVSAFPSGPYFPLNSGAQWQYQINDSGYTYSSTILQGVGYIGETGTKIMQTSDGVLQFFTNDQSGIRLHAESHPGNASTPPYFAVFYPPVKIAEAEFTLGVPVNTSGTVVIEYSGIGTRAVAYSSSAIAQGVEMITVPVGIFQTIHLEWTRDIGGVQAISLWLAPDLGVIKQVASGNTFSLTYTNINDKKPDSFNFTPRTGVAFNQLVESESITVTGIISQADMQIAGGQYSINNGGYTSDPGLIGNGQTVRVRQTSGASYNVTTEAILTIGGVNGTFSVTTITPRYRFLPNFYGFRIKTWEFPALRKSWILVTRERQRWP